jgi:hypothetical protein
MADSIGPALDGKSRSVAPVSAKPKKARNKTHRDFTLSVHKASGQWCKRRNGRLHYLGRVENDPKGIKALEEWTRIREGKAGGEPDTLTVEAMCFRYLDFQESRVANGEISPRTFQCLVATCKTFAEFFNRDRLVTTLTPEDFGKLRTFLASKRNLVGLKNEITRVRSVFKWAYKAELILREVRYGLSFEKPSKKAIEHAREQHRQKHGDKMFEAHEIRVILESASQPMKAMVLLAANCAFGQSDVALLPIKAVDLEKGWVDFSRVKTARKRRIPL